jgi:hypothetical protein
LGMLKSQLKCDILTLTEPVELVGMLKSQLKCTISYSFEPVSWWDAKITT